MSWSELVSERQSAALIAEMSGEERQALRVVVQALLRASRKRRAAAGAEAAENPDARGD